MKIPPTLRLAAVSCALIALLPVAFSAPPKKVVFLSAGTGYSPLSDKDFAELRAAAPGLTIVVADPDHMMTEVADAHAIIGGITPELVRAAQKLEWVQVTSAGVERILFPELKNSAIQLTNMKIVQGPGLADHAFSLLLALTRRLSLAFSARPRDDWNTGKYRLLELNGKTAVIIGGGGSGTLIAVRAKAFGMHVIGVDVRDIPPVPFIDESTRPDRLDDVLPRADVVFVSVPHTPLTEKMFNARRFAAMKPGAFFIVVSRGKTYDADALAAAITRGQLQGAGLDVTDPEPLPKAHPLWKFDNVIITPHVAGRYFGIYKENLVRFSRGEPLVNLVDKQLGY